MNKIEEINQLVLNILEAKSGILNLKQIRSRLAKEGYTIQDQDLLYLLDKLVKKKKVLRVERNKYRIHFNFKPLIGQLDFTKKGSAYFLTKRGSDLFVHESNLLNAMPGDLVEVKVVNSARKKKEAKVVRIIQRANPYISVEVRQVGQRMKFVPRGVKGTNYPQIQIDFKDYDPQPGDLLKLEVDDSKPGKRLLCTFVKRIGEVGETNAEMHAIVNEFGFSTEFDKETLDEANGLSDKIQLDQNRKDLRGIQTFTIDPVNAKDFDDALSFQEKDGLLIIGVHIADVSHFVKESTSLNNEAAERATSVYLVDRTIPMLPEKLSNDLCSLKPNVDRLAYSVLFSFKDNQMVNFEITKTIIHSNRRFTYEEAQEIIEGKALGDFKLAIDTCNQIAKKLRSQRFQNGAINFETPEVRFVLDENAKPIGLSTKIRKDAHLMIEEWMLLANKTVAKFMKTEAGKLNIPFIYRSHDEPSFEKLMDLQLFAKRFGYNIQIDNPKSLSKSINQLIQNVQGKPEEYLFNNLAIRSMAKAIYTTQKSSHFGLAFNYYCHFTSPIRRYPDLLCHRYLHQFLKIKKGTDASRLEKLAQHSSVMEQKAADAERASIKYKQAEFLEDQIGQTFSAIVSGLTEWGIFALIPQFNAEGMIRIMDIEMGAYYFDEKTKSLKSPGAYADINMGQEIEVKVLSANPIQRRIDLGLVSA